MVQSQWNISFFGQACSTDKYSSRPHFAKCWGLKVRCPGLKELTLPPTKRDACEPHKRQAETLVQALISSAMRITREGWYALPRREIGHLATQHSPFTNEGREARTEQVIKRKLACCTVIPRISVGPCFTEQCPKQDRRCRELWDSDRAPLGLGKQLGN